MPRDLTVERPLSQTPRRQLLISNVCKDPSVDIGCGIIVEVPLGFIRISLKSCMRFSDLSLYHLSLITDHSYDNIRSTNCQVSFQEEVDAWLVVEGENPANYSLIVCDDEPEVDSRCPILRYFA